MMISRVRSSPFLHFVAFLGLAGFMSLDVHQQIMSKLFLPTLFVILILYLTDYLVNSIMGETGPLFSLVAMMVIMGWLILLRLEPQLAPKHLLWITLGCLVLVLALKILFILPGDLIVRYNLFWLFLTFLLLFLPLIVGVRVGGAKSWLDIGGFRFQPSEAAKISYLVFLASWFKKNKEYSWQKGKLLWLGTGVSVGLLVLQRDLGTALIFYLTFLLVLYLVSGRLSPSIRGLLFLFIGAGLAYYYFSHVQIRIKNWLNPWQDPGGSGYQILQSLFALASGGILGMGLGAGIPNVIPEAHTDFVFAVIGEQLGLLGSYGIALLYLFFTIFSLRKARYIPTLGSRLIVTGFTFILVIQALVIMGGVTKLIPLTGLPLPFISYGGSSTISSFVMLGLIIYSSQGKDFVSFSIRHRLNNINKFIGILFLLLFINLLFWQVIKAPDLINHPLNPRRSLIEKHTIRGTIYARDGSILACNRNGENKRYYPLGEACAHIIGYSSEKYEKAGLEYSLNQLLLAVEEIQPGFITNNRTGFNIYTTINPQLQKLAWNMHQGQKGATVVLDAKTGNILALVSSPSYDPNNLDENWERYRERDEDVFFNRATQGLYPPGSVFKIITASVLLNLKHEAAQEPLNLEHELNIDGFRIRDLKFRPTLSLKEAIAYSSNLFFIKHFLDFSWTQIEEEINKRFLLTEDFSSPELPIAQAQLGNVLDPVDKAFSIIGQGEVLVTPLHMAIWSGAIANRGLLMQPQIINKIENGQGEIIKKQQPLVLGRACSEKEAQIILEGMEYSVLKGTGTQAQSKLVKIAGKTGTAENNRGDPHAWFVGIAPAENPRVVAVTVVENGGRGGDSAAPIAKSLLEAAFE